MKKIFIVMMIAGILTGCSDSSTKSITVCKGSFDYGDIENTYEAKGDKVIRIVNVTINDYRDTDYDDETLVSTLESQLNVYKEIDGLEIKLTAKDQIVRQEFIIDIENGDLKKLNEVGLIDLNGVCILFSSISRHLPGQWHLDFIPSGYIITLLIEFLRCLFWAGNVQKLPIAI